jgi:hypothetical protein
MVLNPKADYRGSGTSQPLRRSFLRKKVILGHLVVEGLATDAKQICGFLPLPIGPRKGLKD